MKVFFIVPYPVGRAPSQRFRFEQYLSLLQKKNIDIEVSSFMDSDLWNIMYARRSYFSKALGILKGYFRRIKDLFKMRKFDWVFIHREAAPIGPPVFEWIIAKILQKKIIYDFDDAIWMPNYSEYNTFMFYLKRYSNTINTCRWACKVVAGNRYLCDFANKFNEKVILMPTTIDTLALHNKIKKHEEKKLTIGWTGMHSTTKYLDALIPVIEKLEKEYDFNFQVISDKDPKYTLRSYVFKPWSKRTEIEDLCELNIGLMPLPDDKWAKGKCGFKALQYNALGIPAVVSDIGVNSEIIINGENGILCKTEDDWFNALQKLLEDPSLLKPMGERGRLMVEQKYSVQSNSEVFLSLFSGIA